MKRKLRFLAGACLFTATALFSGCSSDDDFLRTRLIPELRKPVL